MCVKTVTASGKSVDGSWVPVASVLVVAVAVSYGKFASWSHGWVTVASVLVIAVAVSSGLMGAVAGRQWQMFW